MDKGAGLRVNRLGCVYCTCTALTAQTVPRDVETECPPTTLAFTDWAISTKPGLEPTDGDYLLPTAEEYCLYIASGNDQRTDAGEYKANV